MAVVGVADTHAALWYLYNDPRLSTVAATFIDQAASSGSRIAVSSISLAEIIYLIEKKRVPANTYADLEGALDDPDHAFSEVPRTKSVVRFMRDIPRASIPDIPDRIVAATALHLGVPVITAGGYIRASAVHTIW